MLVDDVADYLASQGFGDVGKVIFKGEYPEKPDKLIWLHHGGGEHPRRAWAGERPALQIVVRDLTFAGAYATAYELFNLLHGLTSQTMGTCTYYDIDAMSSPEQLGVDKNGRTEFVLNFRVLKNVE